MSDYFGRPLERTLTHQPLSGIPPNIIRCNWLFTERLNVTVQPMFSRMLENALVLEAFGALPVMIHNLAVDVTFVQRNIHGY